MILAFDIGGMSTKVGFINNKYNIEKKDKINYSAKVVEWKELKLLLENYIEKTLENNKIDYLCFSCPGAINVKTGEVVGNSAILGLRGQNVVKHFETKFNIKTFVENDANCAAIAELELGNARKCNNALLCVVGTGVGGALIIDKKIFRGSNYFAAEYGSMYEEELPEYLKNTGFPIQYKCTSFFGMMFACSQYYKETGKQINGFDLFKSYDTDDTSKKIIDNMIFGLAKTIANVALIIDPDLILIGGGISENDLFITKLKDKTMELYKDIILANGKFSIEPTKFNNDANLIGASLMSK